MPRSSRSQAPIHNTSTPYTRPTRNRQPSALFADYEVSLPHRRPEEEEESDEDELIDQVALALPEEGEEEEEPAPPVRTWLDVINELAEDDTEDPDYVEGEEENEEEEEQDGTENEEGGVAPMIEQGLLHSIRPINYLIISITMRSLV